MNEICLCLVIFVHDFPFCCMQFQYERKAVKRIETIAHAIANKSVAGVFATAAAAIAILNSFWSSLLLYMFSGSRVVQVVKVHIESGRIQFEQIPKFHFLKKIT